ncbi:S41 family peptidase [Bacillus carboniphilus]
MTHQKQEISGPEHHKTALGELMLVRGPFGESTEIEVLRNDESLTNTSIYEIENTVTLNQSVSIQEIEEGIFYVPLHGDINIIRLAYYVDLLQSAKGVIFDSRYEDEGMAYLFMQHLFAEPIPSVDIRSPQNILPDQEGVDYKDLGWMIEPKEPTIQGEIVFLASNWGDPILRQIKDYQLGTIIGEQTAGQIGYQNRFLLFDGIYISFTAIKTKGLDGDQHHVHGVIPDILLEPTFEAIQQGRDLWIEEGVQFIKDNQ